MLASCFPQHPSPRRFFLPIDQSRKARIRKHMAKRKRRTPSKKYATKFVGITETVLRSFQDEIESESRRMRAFYIFCHLLIYGSWNFHRPDTPFLCSFRNLMEHTGWSYSRVRDSTADLHKAHIVTRRRSMLKGRAITYKTDCDKLGFRREAERSKRELNRPYKDRRFWGMTRLFVENLRQKTLSEQRHVKSSDELWTTGDIRIKLLWALAHILVYGGWDVNAPDQAFSVTLRGLASILGWNFKTVAKYIKILTSTGVLDVVNPGGLGVPASYALNCGFAGILDVPARNPTKRIDFKAARAALRKQRGEASGDKNCRES